MCILGCTCGYPDCWPLLVKITFDDDVVTWSDFEQPLRKSWEYGDLIFVFDRKEYERELRKYF